MEESKMYLTELLEDQYIQWDHKKIFISAPTGIGKTTFIINRYLNLISIRNKKRHLGRKRKLLILCNRRLLREQYWYELIRKFKYYNEVKENVTIATYQSLAKVIQGDFSRMFIDYEAIVCDEAHYFISDSDFNGLGTFSVLQAIIRAGIEKTLIFMSATPNPAFDEIKRTLDDCKTHMMYEEDVEVSNEWFEKIDCNYIDREDYSHIHPIIYPNDETLIDKIANTSGKTIIFIEDKMRGEHLKQMLIDTKKIHNHEITILNADNLEEDVNSELVASLTIKHVLPTKILITTAVLDNGVSIHDENVRNVVVETESEVSFKQMLGRIRTESITGIDLLFVEKNSNFYKKRMLKLEAEVDFFKNLINQRKQDITSSIYEAWNINNNKDETSMLIKSVIFVNPAANYYNNTDFLSRHKKTRSMESAINMFAFRKISDLYITVSLLYTEAVKDSKYAILKELEWLGISRDECCIEDQEYKEKETEKLVNFLLNINNSSLEEFAEIKRQLVNKFKHMFPDIPAKNGTLENEKFKFICKRYDLFLKIDQVDRKQRYTVCKEEQNVNDKNVDE